MSPAHKILLSPQALSALPQHIPSLNAPPSLGESSSIASGSPCIPAISSAPITPDLQNLVPVEGQAWGGMHDEPALTTPLEIAVDEETSILVSPSEARPRLPRDSSDYSTDWSDVVVRFPKIPGATPQDQTPIEPDMREYKSFGSNSSENGVRLPSDALNLLQNLTRSYSPDLRSDKSGTSRGKQEMKERSETQSRPRSADGMTPLSDYSFSQLSIPSPGGFFSSLQASSRATWCMSNQPKTPILPSSATATNFYFVPFQRQASITEVILEVPDREGTDGPPTARQDGFDIPAEYCADTPIEEEDLYRSHNEEELGLAKKPTPGSHEYDASYDDDLKQAAEVNIDRTSDWLSAQTTYLSALRESNPLNDPADFIPQTPHLLNDESREDTEESPARKAVCFLEEATKATNAAVHDFEKRVKAPKATDSVFLEAFQHCVSQKDRQDAFFQAAVRLESVNSSRLALPVRHVHSLLNTHTVDTLQTHARPKYRGPFSLNPRATGMFHKTKEQFLFAEAERKQQAMDQILPAIWQTEAQRKVFYKGRLLACPFAADRLTTKSKEPSKRLRVLDLAGAATGSWAWSAAQNWPRVKIFTVQTKEHAQLSSQWPVSCNSSPVLPETPTNHHVVNVPELWHLPFRSNFFDVISARTLHMFLRSCPVPEVPSIDEWDLTLKECLRVLKPGGVLDFIVLDSHVSNNSSDNSSRNGRRVHLRGNSSLDVGHANISPSAIQGQVLDSTTPPSTHLTGNNLGTPSSLDFGRELKKHGYDADGGCSKLMMRLKKSGFTDVKRQWVGLPLGRTGVTHENVPASYANIADEATVAAIACAVSPETTVSSKSSLQRAGSISQGNGRSRTPFPPAPRPISEVSSITRIIEQYSNVEAVQGPVGSTADISDMAGLLGTSIWEEWLVRLRLEVLQSGHGSKQGPDDIDAASEATNLLRGINDMLAAGYAKGACFRGIVGWARKPTASINKGTEAVIPATTAIVEPAPTPASASSGITRRNVPRPALINTSSAETYRARAQQRLAARPSFDGFPSTSLPSAVETPSTATTVMTARAVTPSTAMLDAAYRTSYFHGGGIETPVERPGLLRLDTRGAGVVGSPENRFYTESAVERGEVGTIPVMIVE